jgi:hypothetical protein
VINAKLSSGMGLFALFAKIPSISKNRDNKELVKL